MKPILLAAAALAWLVSTINAVAQQIDAPPPADTDRWSVVLVFLAVALLMVGVLALGLRRRRRRRIVVTRDLDDA